MPQQALALGNSDLALRQAKLLAHQLTQQCGGDTQRMITRAYELILGRRPSSSEANECDSFLNGIIPAGSEAARKSMERSVENLVLVLLNHNDFVTVR
jgi:hypothetical protein